jgi:hypothetical protein
VPWLAIGAVVTVAVFLGADLLAPQQCTPTGCTAAVSSPVRLAVAVLIDGGLAVLAERHPGQPQSSLETGRAEDDTRP